MIFKKLNQKGVSEVISYIFLILIIVTVVGIIITGMIPLISEYNSKQSFENTKTNLIDLEDKIDFILKKPTGSTTSYRLNLKNLYLNIDKNQNKIEIFQKTKGDFFEDGIKIQDGRKYNYREGYNLYSGIDYNNINIINDLYLENQIVELFITKTNKSEIEITPEILEDTVWHNNNYDFRTKLLIDKNYIYSDLSNFPVLVNIESNDLKENARSDGLDIVFYDSFGNKLYREIEDYNIDFGTLISWVKIPNLYSQKDNIIYMYYGSNKTQSNSTEVWDDSYNVVLHLNQLSDTMSDSTKNNNNTNLINFDYNETSNYGIKTPLGKGLIFDGINDYLDIPHQGDKEINMSFWGTIDFENSRRFTRKGGGTQSGGFILNLLPNICYRVYLGSSENLAYLGGCNYDFNSDEFNFYTWNYDKNSLKIYINSEKVADIENKRDTSFDDSNIFFGRPYGNGTEDYKGKLDNLVVSNKVRSEDWIKTEYYNQKYPNQFIKLGEMQKRE